MNRSNLMHGAMLCVAFVARSLDVSPFHCECDELQKLQPVSVQEVRLIKCVDGDTLILEPIATRFTVRLINADTWESRRVRRAGSGAITDSEILKGHAAKDAVSELLSSGRIYVETTATKDLESVLRDNFGRVLARVKVIPTGSENAIDVGEWLREHGHTRDEQSGCGVGADTAAIAPADRLDQSGRPAHLNGIAGGCLAAEPADFLAGSPVLRKDRRVSF